MSKRPPIHECRRWQGRDCPTCDGHDAAVETIRKLIERMEREQRGER